MGSYENIRLWSNLNTGSDNVEIIYTVPFNEKISVHLF